jgi:hypothetical protein
MTGLTTFNREDRRGAAYRGGEFVEHMVGLYATGTLYRTFPSNADPPSQRLELRIIPEITGNVTCDLPSPEIDAGCRPPEERAVVPVPETSVNKQGNPVSWENQIRAPGQLLVMQSEPKAPCMQSAPYGDLRGGVCVPD